MFVNCDCASENMRVFILLFLCLLQHWPNTNAQTETTEGELAFHFMRKRLKDVPAAFAGSSDLNAMLGVSQAQSFFGGSASRTVRQQGSRATDKISQLPGQPQGVNFNQYAGYITVEEVAGRALFYYLTESAQSNNSSSSPLILWLSGGPGCSSIGDSLTESGPFRVMSDGKTLYRNPFAWNEVANVLFLESPAGVGFSYSNNTKDYDTFGDAKAAEDSYTFLFNWLMRFPEYKGRDFYMAGVTYAGRLVSQLAQTILKYNRFPPDGSTRINLKGIMIGNPMLSILTDFQGVFDFFWTHAMISDEAHESITKCLKLSPLGSDPHNQPPECADSGKSLADVCNVIDVHNIYARRCYSPGIKPVLGTQNISRADPCTKRYVSAYLNDIEVQKAIHANVTRINHRWKFCTNMFVMNWQQQADSVLPIFTQLMDNNIRIMVYSGDLDSVIPVTSTRYSLNLLKLSVDREWQPWNYGKELAGFSVIYKGNLTFATVREAGRMVSSDQPERALELVKHFLKGEPLPTMEIPDHPIV